MDAELCGQFSDVQQPIALVVAPTRELVAQIFNEARKFAHGSKLRPVVVYGGTSVGHQLREVERGAHIVVGTPGRLLDFINRGKVRPARPPTSTHAACQQTLFGRALELVFGRVVYRRFYCSCATCWIHASGYMLNVDWDIACVLSASPAVCAAFCLPCVLPTSAVYSPAVCSASCLPCVLPTSAACSPAVCSAYLSCVFTCRVFCLLPAVCSAYLRCVFTCRVFCLPPLRVHLPCVLPSACRVFFLPPLRVHLPCVLPTSAACSPAVCAAFCLPCVLPTSAACSPAVCAACCVFCLPPLRVHPPCAVRSDWPG